MATDFRQDYSVLRLYIVGGRMTGGYGFDEAVADYLAMHPDAKDDDVRAELTRAIEHAERTGEYI